MPSCWNRNPQGSAHSSLPFAWLDLHRGELSCSSLLFQVNGAIVKEIGIRVVAVDFEDLGNVSASRHAFEMDDHVQRVSDVGFCSPVGKVHSASQHAACESTECLQRTICVDRRKSPRMPCIQYLQQV